MGNCLSQQRSNEEPLEKKSHLPRLSIDSQSIDGSSISAPNPYHNASLAKRILGTKLMTKLQSSRKSSIAKQNSTQFSSNSSLLESALDSPGSQTNIINRSGRATSAAVRPANAGQYHLSDVLFDPVGFEFLYKFSKKEYSHENLDLLKVLLTINCDDMQAKTNSVSHLLLKKKPDERNMTETEKFITDMERVEEEYLSSGSDYEMNIGFCTFAVLSKRRKGGIEEFAYTTTPRLEGMNQDTATTITTITDLTEKSTATIDSSTTSSTIDSSTAPSTIAAESTSEQITIEEETLSQTPSTTETTATNSNVESTNAAIIPTNKVEMPKISLEAATLNYYKALHKSMLDDCMGNLHDVFVRFMDSREFDQFLESHLQSSISNPSLLLHNK
ncbi:hypothetical protein NAEGRDRAFT_59003 [Naegleria gruberi]|uniref:RGS domain-containing protein n=1 Tax=Naegleria gruberi TaxID=5762 RepID=D2VRB1_NAEGR|nr:uncharacterized protein NAEGRDRAFT_59003 [Naegleria gruberi]EFC40639.1 hypothetical protein NAEGRDRAFT_59003 [Naegleria gruberi]|eukprot:XP_002673383.1 hypothetical protein NAEGRDRAFT_59003 [Naegleria gruberi strain NEG-M]